MKHLWRENSNISLTNVLEINATRGQILKLINYKHSRSGTEKYQEIGRPVGPVRRKSNGKQRSHVTNAVEDIAGARAPNPSDVSSSTIYSFCFFYIIQRNPSHVDAIYLINVTVPPS